MIQRMLFTAAALALWLGATPVASENPIHDSRSGANQNMIAA